MFQDPDPALYQIVDELDDNHCRIILVDFYKSGRPETFGKSYRQAVQRLLINSLDDLVVDPEKRKKLVLAIYYALDLYQQHRVKAGLPKISINTDTDPFGLNNYK